MKVLVTGANGFVGRNLISNLRLNKEIEIFSYDIDSTEEDLDKYTKECEFVFHLAGVNRPEKIEEYISKMNLEKAEKEAFIKHLKSSMNQATEKVNSAIGGSGRNKITYFSHVNEYLSFFLKND